MLLKRVETEGVVKAIYESSNILASKYREATNELTIIFKRGATYKYSDVTTSDYFKFEMADSQGKILNSNIKAKAFSKLEDTDTKKLEKEIDAYKKDDADTFKVGVVENMKAIIADYEDTGDLTTNRLDKLTSMVDRYKEALANQPTAEANA